METWIDTSQTEEEDDGMNDENMQGDWKMYGKRTSKDRSRRKNNWGTKLLDFCGIEKLVILNGRLGKNKKRVILLVLGLIVPVLLIIF